MRGHEVRTPRPHTPPLLTRGIFLGAIFFDLQKAECTETTPLSALVTLELVPTHLGGASRAFDPGLADLGAAPVDTLALALPSLHVPCEILFHYTKLAVWTLNF